MLFFPLPAEKQRVNQQFSSIQRGAKTSVSEYNYSRGCEFDPVIVCMLKSCNSTLFVRENYEKRYFNGRVEIRGKIQYSSLRCDLRLNYRDAC